MRFLHAYYLLNAAFLLLAFPLTRHLLAGPPDRGPEGVRVLTHEKQVALLLGSSLFAQAFRTHSAEHLLALLFSYAKTLALASAFFVSRRCLAATALQVLAVWLLAAPPEVDCAPAAPAVSPAALDAGLRGGRTVVLLHAGWHPGCAHFGPAFGRLARQHGNPALRFATLDLGRWPGHAARLGLELNATSSQLPTVVLYDGDAEVVRLPRKEAGGGVAKGRWSAKDVAAVLQLGTEAAAKKAA